MGGSGGTRPRVRARAGSDPSRRQAGQSAGGHARRREDPRHGARVSRQPRSPAGSVDGLRPDHGHRRLHGARAGDGHAACRRPFGRLFARRHALVPAHRPAPVHGRDGREQDDGPHSCPAADTRERLRPPAAGARGRLSAHGGQEPIGPLPVDAGRHRVAREDQGSGEPPRVETVPGAPRARHRGSRRAPRRRLSRGPPHASSRPSDHGSRRRFGLRRRRPLDGTRREWKWSERGASLNAADAPDASSGPLRRRAGPWASGSMGEAPRHRGRDDQLDRSDVRRDPARHVHDGRRPRHRGGHADQAVPARPDRGDAGPVAGCDGYGSVHGKTVRDRPRRCGGDVRDMA